MARAGEVAAQDLRRGSDLRHSNAAAVVRLLAERGPMARTDVADELSLSTGAITRITARLLDAGIVRELDPVVGDGAGRRRVPIELDGQRLTAVGVHIGVREFTYGLVSLHGRLVGGWHRSERGRTSVADALQHGRELAASLAQACDPDTTVLGVGITSGGIIRRHGSIVSDADWDGWTDTADTNLSATARARATGPVLDNAHSAAARAEMWFGGARELRSFVYFYAGTDIGASIVIDRTVLEGHDAPAARVTHLPVEATVSGACHCGRRRCLQAVAGNETLLARARAAGLPSHLDLRAIDDLARAGDDRAQPLIDARLDAVGQVVATLIDVLAPQRVIVSGRYLDADGRLETLRRAARAHAGRLTDDIIVPSALGGYRQATVISAAATVLERFFLRPLAHLRAADAHRPTGRTHTAAH